jgi:hypothetical protein
MVSYLRTRNLHAFAWLLVTITLIQMPTHSGAATVAWPRVAMPNDAVAYAIGDQMTVNGIPLRTQGFFVKTTPGATASWFRQHLGKPLVENKLGRALVLGKAEGQHYITVTLSPEPVGTSGTVTVADLQAAHNSRDTRKAATQRLLSRLPPGSELLTELLSTDGGKQSRYFVLSNTYHEDVNRDRILDFMREAGLALRFQAAAPGVTLQRDTTQLSNGTVFVFNGDRKEAVAVIGRNVAGRTVVQVNVISEMARYE